MKLSVVGCSGSMSGPAGPASCYLVQSESTSIALDFGPGAMGQLLNVIDPAELDAIVLSHLHADHCADLVGMQVYRRWFPGNTMGPIPVYSPGDGLARTRNIGGDDESEDYAGEFDFRTVAPGDSVMVGDLSLSFTEAWHPVPAVATRITSPEGRTLAYSGDTDTCEGQVEAARGVDTYLCEAAFEKDRDDVRGIHLTGQRAGELAATAGASRLILTHLQPWTDPATVSREARDVFDGEVEVAVQGAVYTI